MRIVSKKDIYSGLITGATTGFIGWRVLDFLGSTLPMGIDPIVLPLIIPFLWVAGVQLGYLLGQFMKPFTQFGRFACIGFANAAVDFGVFYALVAWVGLTAAAAFSLFKAISFSFATVHSYYWNKTWTFEATTTAGGKAEFLSFLSVAVSGLLVNVAVASMVYAVQPASIAVESWAGIASIAGSALSLIFSFVGFRVFVFKKTV